VPSNRLQAMARIVFIKRRRNEMRSPNRGRATCTPPPSDLDRPRLPRRAVRLAIRNENAVAPVFPHLGHVQRKETAAVTRQAERNRLREGKSAQTCTRLKWMARIIARRRIAARRGACGRHRPASRTSPSCPSIGRSSNYRREIYSPPSRPSCRPGRRAPWPR